MGRMRTRQDAKAVCFAKRLFERPHGKEAVALRRAFEFRQNLVFGLAKEAFGKRHWFHAFGNAFDVDTHRVLSTQGQDYDILGVRNAEVRPARLEWNPNRELTMRVRLELEAMGLDVEVASERAAG